MADPERLGTVALGVQRLGARFAMTRDAVVQMLETARAALDGRDYVIPDDVKILAVPALRHRLVLSPSAEIEGRRVDQVLAGLVERVAAPR